MAADSFFHRALSFLHLDDNLRESVGLLGCVVELPSGLSNQIADRRDDETREDGDDGVDDRGHVGGRACGGTEHNVILTDRQTRALPIRWPRTLPIFWPPRPPLLFRDVLMCRRGILTDDFRPARAFTLALWIVAL